MRHSLWKVLIAMLALLVVSVTGSAPSDDAPSDMQAGAPSDSDGAPSDSISAHFDGYCSAGGEVLTGTGALSHHIYGTSDKVCWFVTCDSPSDLQLEFTSFDTEAFFDIVQVIAFDGSTHSMAGSYSGYDLPPSSSMTMANSQSGYLIHFKSDGSASKNGFSLNYQCTQKSSRFDGDCVAGGEVLTGTGALSHHIYGTSDKVCWFVTCDSPADVLKLEFHRFSTEADKEVLRVMEFDGVSHSLANTISGHLSYSYTLSMALTNSQSGYLLHFEKETISDFMDLDNENGFEINYHCGKRVVEPVDSASAHFDGYCADGVVLSGKGALWHNQGYGNNENLCWFITCDSQSDLLELEFTTISTEEGFDHVRVIGFDGSTHSTSGSYTGAYNDYYPTRSMNMGNSQSGYLIHFESDSVITNSGFSLNYQCISQDVKPSDSGGALSDPISAHFDGWAPPGSERALIGLRLRAPRQQIVDGLPDLLTQVGSFGGGSATCSELCNATERPDGTIVEDACSPCPVATGSIKRVLLQSDSVWIIKLLVVLQKGQTVSQLAASIESAKVAPAGATYVGVALPVTVVVICRDNDDVLYGTFIVIVVVIAFCFLKKKKKDVTADDDQFQQKTIDNGPDAAVHEEVIITL
eukprot:TRINITY_DN776_c0_g1_i2.p1 TRINITY_DN776_c0_g1~~TRINITY_DN776_c0_g1_i2.p1  ORF type:complete len:637 (+),score=98.33 TRINITY_DN776_c0_g1_i2:47-1957(+)